MQFGTALNDKDSDCVGGPLSHNVFKLVDVPEMGYTH